MGKVFQFYNYYCTEKCLYQDVDRDVYEYSFEEKEFEKNSQVSKINVGVFRPYL